MWRKSKYLASPPEVPRVLELLGYLLVELGKSMVSASFRSAIPMPSLRHYSAVVAAMQL